MKRDAAQTEIDLGQPDLTAQRLLEPLQGQGLYSFRREHVPKDQESGEHRQTQYAGSPRGDLEKFHQRTLRILAKAMGLFLDFGTSTASGTTGKPLTPRQCAKSFGPVRRRRAKNSWIR